MYRANNENKKPLLPINDVNTHFRNDRKTGIKTIQLMNNCLLKRNKLSESINYKQAISYINVLGESSKSSLPIL